MTSLYEIIRQIRNLYKVKLPNLIKIHLVFLLDHLRKAATDPLLGQQNEPLLLIQITSD